MSGKNKIALIFGLTAFAAVPIALFGDVTGANPGYTGAPGNSTCTSCHSGTAVNGGAGSIKIVLPGDATYSPGVKQHVTVQVSDPAQKRWGFELTARSGSGNTAQAGDLASTDSNTRVMCSNGRSTPCSASNPIEYITHTLSGTRLGTTGGTTFEFDWTPPATDVGPVTLYAAGNAANGNNSDSGDHIYTTSVTLQAVSAAPKPTIQADAAGVTNGASYQGGIAPNSWVMIKGSNLASTTRIWTGADLLNGALPTTMDGVSVTLNGEPAYIYYVSPTQVNVLAPADLAPGPVQAKVTFNGATSDPGTVTVQQFSPAFFTFDGKYLAAAHAAGGLVGAPGLFASSPDATTPAKPGETVVLFANGLGPVDQSEPAGFPADKLANVSTPYTVTIGGVQANVSFAGLIPGFAGLYQLNVDVPAGLASGDQPVAIQIGGQQSLNTTACCFITVQQ